MTRRLTFIESIRRAYARGRQDARTDGIHEAARAVVDGAEGTPEGVVVPLHLLDALAEAVDKADAEVPA